jgi:hypothetical protein
VLLAQLTDHEAIDMATSEFLLCIARIISVCYIRPDS